MKCALYCRLSEEDRNKQFETDDSNSIQNQKSMLSKYAIEQGWEIYDIYSDDDYTGSDRNRPEFNRLLTDAKSRRFDIIICKTQSRFTRELELVEKYIHGLLPLWGIRFIGIVDNADTFVQGNKKSRQINGLVNEWYLEDLSENIKSVLTNRREEGKHIGAFALYGYLKDPNEKGHLIIDEEAAMVVREVFTLFLKGYGKTNIARMLNERGIPNPTEYKRLKGLRYKTPKGKYGTKWSYFAIADMLVNEIYVGNMVQGKYGSISYKSKINKPRPKDKWIFVKNTHEPIIDQELWDGVQSLIKQKTKPFITGEIGIFAKKVYCMYCGYSLRSSKSRDRHYLKCSQKHYAKDSCQGAFVPVHELEQIVLNEIRKLNEELLNNQTLVEGVNFNNSLLAKIDTLSISIKDFEAKKEDCITGLKQLYLDKIKGSISEADYALLSLSFTTDREKYETLISNHTDEINKAKKIIQSSIDKASLIQQYIDIDCLTREIVDTLIDKICVGKRDPITKVLPVEIYWNF